MSRMRSYRRESLIERFFVSTCELKRWIALKFKSPTMTGLPDRMVLKGMDEAKMHVMLWQGVSEKGAETHIRALLAMCVEFVELKSPDGRFEPGQERRIAMLQELGFTVHVFDTKEQIIEWAGR